MEPTQRAPSPHEAPAPAASPRRPPSTSSEEAADSDGGGGGPELPLTMSASVVLADLPRDAAAALASAAATAVAGTGGASSSSAAAAADAKVVVRFKPVGAAPALAQDVCKITAARRFEEVVRYLRRKLRCGDTDSVFLYVNSAFAPSLDEVVGNLHQCFKNAQDQLIVAYSMTPAFG